MTTAKQALMDNFLGLADNAKIVLAIRMPNGSTELIINENAKAKLEYIDRAYDDYLCLKACPDIYIVSHMFYV